MTALVAFAGSQPEPFLIAPAAALLAALTTQMPRHFHFAPCHLAQARLNGTSIQQSPAGPHSGHHGVPLSNAVLVKEASSSEEQASDDGFEATDILVLESPFLHEDGSFSRLARTYPCLLVPSQVRGNAEQ